MTRHKNQPFFDRLQFALAGFAHALRNENSLKFQGAVLVVVQLVLGVFRPEPVWWALVLLASGAVLAAELFNTALERLADHLHPEIHPEIKIVKDCAAAAVLLTVVGAGGVGIALVVHLASR